MKYRELKDRLEQLTDEQLDMDLSVLLRLSEEVIPGGFGITEDDDILDKNHPIIVVEW